MTNLLSEKDAEIILLIVWLLTFKEADKAGLGITKFEDWPWGFELGMILIDNARGNVALNWWITSERYCSDNKDIPIPQVFWRKLIYLAWQIVSEGKINKKRPKKTNPSKKTGPNRYKLIAVLQEFHRLGTDEIKHEVATSKEIEQKLGWNQPKVHREMKKLFGENPMQKYKQCFATNKLSGFMKQLEDGTYEVDAISEPNQE